MSKRFVGPWPHLSLEKQWCWQHRVPRHRGITCSMSPREVPIPNPNIHRFLCSSSICFSSSAPVGQRNPNTAPATDSCPVLSWLVQKCYLWHQVGKNICRFSLFPINMPKASPESSCTKHIAQADTTASASDRKGNPRTAVGLLGTGMVAKPLLEGSLKWTSCKAAPQYTQAAIAALRSHPALHHLKHSSRC